MEEPRKPVYCCRGCGILCDLLAKMIYYAVCCRLCVLAPSLFSVCRHDNSSLWFIHTRAECKVEEQAIKDGYVITNNRVLPTTEWPGEASFGASID